MAEEMEKRQDRLEWEVGVLKERYDHMNDRIGEMSIRTDEQSQARVASLVTVVQADPEADNFDFEAQPNQWVTVNRDTAITIGKAVSAHVQACFTRCRELHELINAATTISDLETIDINEDW